MKRLSVSQTEWLRFAVALILLVAVLLLAACKSTRHMATHDTIYVNTERVEYQWRHDSIYLDRWHDRWVIGDTVYMRDSVVHYRWHTKIDTLALHDSVYISKSDTTTVQVKKPLTAFVKGQIAGFWVLLVGVLLAVAWWLFKTFYLRK
jgi:hypothetical protein